MKLPQQQLECISRGSVLASTPHLLQGWGVGGTGKVRQQQQGKGQVCFSQQTVQHSTLGELTLILGTSQQASGSCMCVQPVV